jgi:hypothetical protein
MPYKFNPFTGTFDDSSTAGPTGPTGPTGTVSAAGSGTTTAPGIAFSADTNTGIWNPSADQLGLTTNGITKLTVDDTTAPVKELFSGSYYPIATQVDVGTAPNQIPLNGYLGALAFQSRVSLLNAAALPPASNLDINFEYVSDTSIKIRMRGSDGTVRSATLTLS